MTDANEAGWNESSLLPWDESDTYGIPAAPADALYCSICLSALISEDK
jgi:hypothetical protein